MRPLGGALVGHIGDRYGRRAALTFSVVAMAIPTFLVGLLPGYATIGLAAPVALTLLRSVQGLAVGGEYTSSMVFLIEHASAGRRGLMGALVCCAGAGGILLGSAVGACFAAAMPAESLDAWGWRIPFVLGLGVGIAGYVLRRHAQETLPAEQPKRAPESGLGIERPVEALRDVVERAGDQLDGVRGVRRLRRHRRRGLRPDERAEAADFGAPQGWGTPVSTPRRSAN